ncbi:MAG: flagellar hook assembly protein FlgD [Candidatus Marinimicrobia bacterium]|nr:flagellar hook assembly protein FlgD [Candidatus Neomarinimicrobiota bacterium]MCF7880504.1 flagellar hook assembly protein FlgD [Candidatus Neomarinimicrobiota bacterium]
MQIPLVGGTGNTSQSGQSGQSESVPGGEMDKQAFLQLLVTQMRHQDPMDPMKGQEYAAQLAQFSSVEQLTNLNDRFDQMQQSNVQLSRSISNTLAATIVGKRIQAVGNAVAYNEGEDTSIRFNLENAAKEVKLTIRDSNDQVVKTENLGSMLAGEQEYQWNGRYNLLGRADDGETFTYTIEATDREGNKVSTNTFTQGKISAVEYGNGGQLYFLLGNMRVSAGNVHRIYDGG